MPKEIDFYDALEYQEQHGNLKGFRGNKNLKGKNIKHTWTKKQIEELSKCAKDPLYFIDNYCKVVSVDKGVVPFKLYDYQRKFIKLMHTKRWVISRQARQSGKSISVAAYLLYYALFNDHKTLAILANKADSAREIMGRLQLMYENLPIWLQQGVLDWNKGSVTFENNSKIISAPTSSSAIRGKSVSCVTENNRVQTRNRETGQFETITILELHNRIKKTKENKKYEILTTTGYELFDDVVITGKRKTLVITLENGDYVECTHDHLLLTPLRWFQAGQLKVNEDSLLTKNGFFKITNIEETNEEKTVYDILNVWNSHNFCCSERGEIIVHNCLYLDEYAFVPKNIADEFMTSVYPTISSGKDTKIIITSTPFGLNHFYKLWTDAIEGRNGYTPLEVFWHQVPGRDKKWKEETWKNIGEEAFLQEYDIEFIGSAGTLIDPKKLKTLVYKQPIHDDNNGLKIYAEPIKSHTYIITVDCSEGIGLDYMVVNVMDITEIPYQQVAIYRSNTIDPHLLPDIIIKISQKYNEAYVLCELNSTGVIVTSILWNELEYDKMLWCSQTGINKQKLGAYGNRSQMGIKTSVFTKRTGCSILKTLIETDQLIVNDYNTLQELYAFARKGNSYEAQEGNNDDTVATLFIFAWMTKEEEFSNILEQSKLNADNYNIRKRLSFNRINDTESLLEIMPVIDDGVEDEDPLSKSKKFHSMGFSDLFF